MAWPPPAVSSRRREESNGGRGRGPRALCLAAGAAEAPARGSLREVRIWWFSLCRTVCDFATAIVDFRQAKFAFSVEPRQRCLGGRSTVCASYKFFRSETVERVPVLLFSNVSVIFLVLGQFPQLHQQNAGIFQSIPPAIVPETCDSIPCPLDFGL